MLFIKSNEFDNACLFLKASNSIQDPPPLSRCDSILYCYVYVESKEINESIKTHPVLFVF